VKQILKIFLVLIICSRGYSQQMLMFKEAEIPKPKNIDETVLKWNQNQAGFSNLSLKEQQFYYWVNYSRFNPERFFDSVVKPMAEVYPQLKGKNYESLEKDLANTQKLPLFFLHEDLGKMADFHAKDITSHNATPSHNSVNGETFADRFKRFNLKNCGGENISNGAGSTDILLMIVLLYLDINVPDLGHRKSLLNPAFINTGIGAASYKNGNIFIVEDFACDQK
jgi:Cysteine-rich secretory protein family